MKTFFKVLFFIAMLSPVHLKAQNSIAVIIKHNKGKLHYSRSVARFYEEEGYRLMWILEDTVKTPAWDAMQLLDCVLQYGLDPNDYHPQQLAYQSLNAVQNVKATNSDKALFDILMTDAIINLINNLHYGKFNPDFPKSRIDAANTAEFKGDKILLDALENRDLMAVINVQPHAEAYTNLRRHLLLLTTKYSGNNYIKPEKDIHKLAINMEWLRWINTTGKPRHLTCIVMDGVMKDINR